MTQPEATMTREQVLEEALRPFAQMADEVEREYGQDLPDFQLQFPRVTMGQLRAARAALASTRQEPAPAGDAEKLAQATGFRIRVWIQDRREKDGKFGVPYCDELSRFMDAEIAAALRRYAGDGVTEEMVEAARAEFFHRGLMIRSENVRAALEAAVRASSEKGGAR